MRRARGRRYDQAMSAIERYFRLAEAGTTARTEVVAGVTTFLTMSYIIFVNPAILADAGMPASGVLTATVLVCAVSSILMGLWANLPYGLAPGMGINAFFTYTLCIGQNIPWQTALGATFISGLIFILLTVTHVRRWIVDAIPLNLRRAVAAGIGLFIAFIGLRSAGVIAPNPATLVGLGKLDGRAALFLAGFALTALLLILRLRAALLIGILATTLLSLVSGRITPPQHIFSAPDFSSVFLQLDVRAALTAGMIAPIFTMLMTDLFDSLSTFVGVAQVSNLLDDQGRPKNIQQALMVDAVSTTISGLSGTSAGTTYIESAAGVEAGGRTGLTAVVIGLLFLPFLFAGPLAAVIPAYATAPALVIVGVYMMRDAGKINFSDWDEAIPAFLAMIMIPLSYSITQGIVWGFLSYTVLKLLARKARELHPMMYVIAILSALVLSKT